MGAALGPEAADAPRRMPVVDEDIRASVPLVGDASGSAVDSLLPDLGAVLAA